MLLCLLVLALPQAGFWNDPNTPAWIAVGLAVIAIVIGIWAAVYQVRKQRELQIQQQTRKELTYYTVSKAPIVTINTSVKSRVQVLLDQQPAEGIQLVVLKVKNTGTIAIKKEDYFEPLTFKFEGDVVGGEILDTEPGSLKGSFNLNIKGEQVELPALSLNPADAITFSVLVKDKSSFTLRQGRIETGKINQESMYTIMNLNSIAPFWRISTNILSVILFLLPLTFIILLIYSAFFVRSYWLSALFLLLIIINEVERFLIVRTMRRESVHLT